MAHNPELTSGLEHLLIYGYYDAAMFLIEHGVPITSPNILSDTIDQFMNEKDWWSDYEKKPNTELFDRYTMIITWLLDNKYFDSDDLIKSLKCYLIRKDIPNPDEQKMMELLVGYGIDVRANSQELLTMVFQKASYENLIFLLNHGAYIDPRIDYYEIIHRISWFSDITSVLQCYDVLMESMVPTGVQTNYFLTKILARFSGLAKQYVDYLCQRSLPIVLTQLLVDCLKSISVEMGEHVIKNITEFPPGLLVIVDVPKYDSIAELLDKYQIKYKRVEEKIEH